MASYTAYHGARAEKQGFTITLERSLDPAAGAADVFPQDITRALLNLISNGFYAATKRKTEANGGDYEPTLTAATKNLGDRVEISDSRQWHRYSARGEGKDVQSVLHDKASREKAPGLASPSVTTSSSSNMAGLSRSTRSRASSPSFGSFCRARLCSNPARLEIRHRLLTAYRVATTATRSVYICVAFWLLDLSLQRGS